MIPAYAVILGLRICPIDIGAQKIDGSTFSTDGIELTNFQIKFADQELNWKTYTLNEALPTTKQMQIIDRKEFAIAALASEKAVFVMHVAYLEPKMLIHPDRKAQIALFLAKKISVSKKYANFSDFFSKKSAVMLPNCLDINKYAIDLEPDK